MLARPARVAAADRAKSYGAGTTRPNGGAASFIQYMTL